MTAKDEIILYGDRIGKILLIDHMGSDKRIVQAARTSYGKLDDENEDITPKDVELIQYLMDNDHTVPFEHCHVTILFKVPMFVARQHMRYRTWNFSELSRRFTKLNLEFYNPIRFRTQDENNKQGSEDPFTPDMSGFSTRTAEDLLLSHVESGVELYHAYLNAGISKEMARMCLPQNLYTQYYGTCDLHNLFHFLDQRLHPHAQFEIQQVAKAVLMILETLFPNAVEAWKKKKKPRFTF